MLINQYVGTVHHCIISDGMMKAISNSHFTLFATKKKRILHFVAIFAPFFPPFFTPEPWHVVFMGGNTETFQIGAIPWIYFREKIHDKRDHITKYPFLYQTEHQPFQYPFSLPIGSMGLDYLPSHLPWFMWPFFTEIM